LLPVLLSQELEAELEKGLETIRLRRFQTLQKEGVPQKEHLLLLMTTFLRPLKSENLHFAAYFSCRQV
jgi:hypothetical protein